MKNASKNKIIIRILFWVLALTVLLGIPTEFSIEAKTLRVSVQALPPSLFNPYRNTGLPYVYAWSATFDGLTAIDENGMLQPWLATSWENVDPLTWIIRLRDDVIFSNGKPFTADAVVAVVNFLTSKESVKEVVARMMFFLESARVIDDKTVEIKTRVPTPLLPRFLPQFYMVEPEHFLALGLEGFAREPVATGPFILEEIRPDRAELAAFGNSWRAPRVDKLRILVLPEKTTRTFAIQTGQLDIALNMGPDEVAQIVASGGKKVFWLDAAIWAYHIVDGRHPALDDVRVREALNIAVDRQVIIDNLLDGVTIPATQPAPPMVYGFNPDLPPIPYDPERANALLADAGYPEGFNMVIEATAGSSANDSAVNLMVAQYLAAVGVNVEIRTVTSPQIIRHVMEGTFRGHAFGLHYNFEPSIEVLRALDTNSCLWSFPWYCREEVMPMIHAAQREFDPDTNLKIRKDIMTYYRKDWASIFMYQAPRFAATASNVSGLNVVNNFIMFDRIVIED